MYLIKQRIRADLFVNFALYKYLIIIIIMFMSCVHPVAVLNAAFCMTSSLFMLVEDTKDDHIEEAYSRAGLMAAL